MENNQPCTCGVTESILNANGEVIAPACFECWCREGVMDDVALQQDTYNGDSW